ncbi:GGDEF domain-containing protein [Vibrio sp. TBV020]|uniref:GGDEF domain-containing protein n=1 Tax=Vibrio sp. TBV020 TaxID=3137398 RepID=UPI0038CD981A
MIALSIAMMMLQFFVAIDSNYDLLFESNTLFIIVYIYVVARDSIFSNTKLKFGMWILIFNKFYDVLTEVQFFDRIADSHEFIDTFLEDGLLQISFLIIAFGLTEIIRDVKENAATDELTGLYNRKKLDSIHLNKFDLIYLDLDGLKRVNDSKGHHVGDLMIIRFAQALNSSLCSKGRAYRVGGDEFIVIVPVSKGDTFITSLENTLDGEQISFSYGIEQSTSKESFREALIKTDKAMYEMKNSQRKG